MNLSKVRSPRSEVQSPKHRPEACATRSDRAELEIEPPRVGRCAVCAERKPLVEASHVCAECFADWGQGEDAGAVGQPLRREAR